MRSVGLTRARSTDSAPAGGPPLPRPRRLRLLGKRLGLKPVRLVRLQRSRQEVAAAVDAVGAVGFVTTPAGRVAARSPAGGFLAGRLVGPPLLRRLCRGPHEPAAQKVAGQSWQRTGRF